MSSGDELARTLRRIDGRGYRSYKDLRGSYRFPEFELFIDHVQGDPFAAAVEASPAGANAGRRAARGVASQRRFRRIALQDFLARVNSRRDPRARRARSSAEEASRIDAAPGQRTRWATWESNSGSGQERADLDRCRRPGGARAQRRSCCIPSGSRRASRSGLPAAGRRVLGRQAISLLTRAVPEVALAGLTWQQTAAGGSRRAARRFVECVENQEHIRTQLGPLGLVAFVANGSILPA